MYLTAAGVERRVKLPAGAVLVESVRRSGTLKGMIGVYWEGRITRSSYATYSRKPSAYPLLKRLQHYCAAPQVPMLGPWAVGEDLTRHRAP